MIFRLAQCEEDKTTKDNQIHSLQEELVAQEEMVTKLNREKRLWADGRQKNEEDLQAAEDRANHLNRVKAKLEQNLDELEDSVEREKKVRNIFIPTLTFNSLYMVLKLRLDKRNTFVLSLSDEKRDSKS